MFQDPNYTTKQFRKVISAFHSFVSLKLLARVVSSVKKGIEGYTRMQNLSTFQPFFKDFQLFSSVKYWLCELLFEDLHQHNQQTKNKKKVITMNETSFKL